LIGRHTGERLDFTKGLVKAPLKYTVSNNGKRATHTPERSQGQNISTIMSGFTTSH